MKTLKEIMDLGSFFGVDDMSIIKEYLMQPEIIDKAPQLIVDVMQEKINEYARLRRMQLTWGVQSFGFYYDDFPRNIAAKFVSLTLKHVAKALTEEDYAWAREELPKMKLKNAFYRPLLQDLNMHGAWFKNQDKKKEIEMWDIPAADRKEILNSLYGEHKDDSGKYEELRQLLLETGAATSKGSVMTPEEIEKMNLTHAQRFILFNSFYGLTGKVSMDDVQRQLQAMSPSIYGAIGVEPGSDDAECASTSCEAQFLDN